MRKIGKGLVSVLLAAALTLPLAFAAAAEELPQVEIPVTITLEGSKPSTAEDLQVILKANDAGCPMPEGSVDGIYAMTITGGGTKYLPAITFSKLGIYGYTIYQEPGANAKGTYDETVYHVTAYVTNAADSGFEAAVVMHVDGVEAKPGSVQFTDSYRSSGTSGGGGGGSGSGGRVTEGPTSGGPGVISDNLIPLDAADVPLAGIMDNPVPLFGILPKTGDTTNLMLWAVLMALSACGLIGLIIVKKRMD